MYRLLMGQSNKAHARLARFFSHRACTGACECSVREMPGVREATTQNEDTVNVQGARRKWHTTRGKTCWNKQKRNGVRLSEHAACSASHFAPQLLHSGKAQNHSHPSPVAAPQSHNGVTLHHRHRDSLPHTHIRPHSNVCM
ncbi:hypothetical protein TRVL_09374 [Trypanosoma vivax]|nr:hypothetical protein TRVL_09374 [Trypanosoma vivax]